MLGARLLVAGMYVERFLPLWCVCPCVYLAAGFVRACSFLCLGRSFFLSFFWFVWSFLFPSLCWCCLFVLFSLLSFRPRAALPWGFLGPLENHILTYPTQRNAIWN